MILRLLPLLILPLMLGAATPEKTAAPGAEVGVNLDELFGGQPDSAAALRVPVRDLGVKHDRRALLPAVLLLGLIAWPLHRVKRGREGHS